jgi:hypothetical protein
MICCSAITYGSASIGIARGTIQFATSWSTFRSRSGGVMDDNFFGLPNWLVTQTTTMFFVFPTCLMILGVDFWKAAAITIIVCAAMLIDFCRKLFVIAGGLVLTAVLLEWVGVNTTSLSEWVHHVFY